MSGDKLSLLLFFVGTGIAAVMGAFQTSGWRSRAFWAAALLFGVAGLAYYRAAESNNAILAVRTLWALAPLVAVSLSFLAFGGRRPVPPALDKSPSGADDKGKAIPALLQLTASTPKALEEVRAFVGKGVSVDTLSSFFKVGTGLDGRRLMAPYLNKWMIVRGVFANASHSYLKCAVKFKRTDYFQTDIICLFEESWLEKLELLQPGQEIAISGRIFDADQHGCTLTDCELVALIDAGEASWVGDALEQPKPKRERAVKPKAV